MIADADQRRTRCPRGCSQWPAPGGRSASAHCTGGPGESRDTAIHGDMCFSEMHIFIYLLKHSPHDFMSNASDVEDDPLVGSPDKS